MLRLYLATRDFQPVDIPVEDLASDVISAVFRGNSVLLDQAIREFFLLPCDEGGYGCVVMEEEGLSLLRCAVADRARVMASHFDRIQK